MKIFVDTNVLLDVLSRREPFYADSARIWSLAEKGDVQAYVSAISFNNVYYIIRKLRDRKTAEKALRILRDIFEPVAPDRQILNQSIDADMADFEDAVQFHSAIRAKAFCLVTRNPDHFPRSPLPILSPDEFLSSLPSVKEESPRKTRKPKAGKKK